jgi:hypothetical protein
MEIRQCANQDCGKDFQPKVHNGIYCCAECRKIATNKNILDKYHAKKENKSKKRICATKNCNTILSIYNEKSICELCKIKEFDRMAHLDIDDFF